MLQELSPDQAALMPVIRDRFIRAGLSTAPADFDAAEAAIADAYREAGLAPPARYVRLASPLAGAMAALMIDPARDLVRDQVPDHIRKLVFGRVRDPVRDRVRDQVSEQVWGEVWDRVWGEVWDRVRSQVWIPVRDRIEDHIRDLVHALDRERAVSVVAAAVYGQHDAGLLSFYGFFAACGVPGVERLGPMMRLAEAAGWCWFFRDVAIITDRPSALHRDESGRLHSATGPAIEYRDGFRLYAWHGYRLPDSHAWIITDTGRITAEAIMAEPNAELRRVMCEVSGFVPIRAVATEIAADTDGNGHPRRLLSAEIGGSTIRIVEVVNGSAEPDGSHRTFLLGAMPGATPHEAIAASYGVAPEHYREAVRT